mgnify:CR=1 FL=1
MLSSKALDGRVKLYETGVPSQIFVAAMRSLYEECYRILHLFRPRFHGQEYGNWLSADRLDILHSVKRHCAMQAARAYTLGMMLRLDGPEKTELVIAALLHDTHKLEEIRTMESFGRTCENYDAAQEQAHHWWLGLGIEPEVVKIASSVGHESLLEMWFLCCKYWLEGELTPLEVCRLAMHFLDDISIGGNWVDVIGNDGENILDARSRKNASNPRYADLNAHGLEGQKRKLRETAARVGCDLGWNVFLPDETAYEAQARIGHMVEAVLSKIVSQRNKTQITDPKNLPVILDNQLWYLLCGEPIN